jgi:hypothetical protein
VPSGRVYISRDVVFDENIFPFSELHSNARARLQSEINLLDPTLTSSWGTLLVDQCTNIDADVANEIAEKNIVPCRYEKDQFRSGRRTRG